MKPKDLAAAGVVPVPRVAGMRDGRPVLDDGRVLDVDERHLVHGIRSRVFVGRHSRVRSAWAAVHDAVSSTTRARALLRRAALPLLDVVDDDPRRRARFGVRRKCDHRRDAARVVGDSVGSYCRGGAVARRASRRGLIAPTRAKPVAT